MAEASIVRGCQAELDKRGAWHQKIHGSQWMGAGIPDILACWRGRFLAIECKQPGLEPDSLQRLVMSRIRRAGGITLIAHSRQELAAELDQLEVKAA